MGVSGFLGRRGAATTSCTVAFGAAGAAAAGVAGVGFVMKPLPLRRCAAARRRPRDDTGRVGPWDERKRSGHRSVGGAGAHSTRDRERSSQWWLPSAADGASCEQRGTDEPAMRTRASPTTPTLRATAAQPQGETSVGCMRLEFCISAHRAAQLRASAGLAPHLRVAAELQLRRELLRRAADVSRGASAKRTA